jgi:valyl-tRNA synthetase
MLTEAPHVPLEQLSGMDVWMFARLKELVAEGTTLNVTSRSSELIGLVGSFLRDEVFPYLRDKAQDRLSARDPSLLFALYTAGLTCLKLLHDPLPKVSEELYVTYFRDLEGASTVADISWSSAVM